MIAVNFNYLKCHKTVGKLNNVHKTVEIIGGKNEAVTL